MTRLPIDYSKNVIYGIFSNADNSCVYVGHTTNFIKRKQHHKSDCNNEKSEKYIYKLYKSIRDNGGWDDYTMRLIEEYPCNTSQEALEREFYNFEKYSPSFNSNVPIISDYKEYYKEYKIANRDKILQHKKKYRDTNKEKIREYDRKYYEKKKEINQS